MSLLLFVFTALLLVAAWSVAKDISRVETAMATLTVFSFVVVTLGFALGSFGVLSTTTLGLSAAGLSLAAIAVRRHQFNKEDARAIAALPLRALFLNPFALVVLGLFCWLFFAALFSPARGNNDALFYHEPIVAFALQNGHLGPYDLPAHLQRINGMPRFAHLVQLWFAAFTGREHVELANLMALVLGTLSTYGVARQMRIQQRVAIWLGLTFAVTPGLMRLACGVMVDVPSAAWVSAALYFVVHKDLTTRRALLASAAIALTCASKYHVLPLTFLLALALAVRLWRTPREKRLLLFATCAALVIAALCSLYVRNLVLFENPIWPAGIKIPFLNYTLRSAHDLRDALTSGKGLGAGEVIHRWFSAPFSVRPWQGGSARTEDYGMGGLYIVWPFAGLASLVALYRLARLRSKADWRPVLLVLMFAAAIATFPAIVRGRYWLVAWTPMLCLAALATSKTELRRAVIVTLFFLNLLSCVLTLRHGWLPSWSDTWTRVATPRAERDYTLRQLSSATREFGKIRHEEMKPGDVVGFDAMYSVGVLWRDDYANIVMHLKGRDPIAAAEKLDVDWMVLQTKTFKELKREPDGWAFRGKVLKRRGRHPSRLYQRVRSE